jgi:CRISPR-associated protein Csx14
MVEPTILGPRRNDHPVCLIATLGTEPQVVTLALQALLNQGEAVGEVAVGHIGLREPRIAEAARRLDTAFGEDERLTTWRGHYRRTVILEQAGPVDNVLAEEDFGATPAALCRLVRDTKKAGYRIHLNVSGGGKLMSLCGAMIAQLLFGQDDRLWYVQSRPELVAAKLLWAPDPAR